MIESKKSAYQISGENLKSKTSEISQICNIQDHRGTPNISVEYRCSSTDSKNEAVRAFVCGVCGSKIVGKDLYFLHLQQCKNVTFHRSEKTCESSCVTDIENTCKNNISVGGNVNHDSGIVSEKITSPNHVSKLSTCCNSKKTAPNSEINSDTGIHVNSTRKPYIHKKFDHDQGRKVAPTAAVTGVQCFLRSFQSHLVRKLNHTKESHLIPAFDDSSPVQVITHSPISLVEDSIVLDAKPTSGIENKKLNQSPNCIICSKTFSTSYLLIRHLKETHSDDLFFCHLCDSVFKCKRSLTNHEGTHHLVKSYHCKQCNHACLTASGLRSHKSEVHCRITEEKLKCHLCVETFRKKYGLERHIKRKHKKETHECRYCDKLFPCKEDLKQHLTVHLTVKNLRCNICDKTFITPKSLKRHSLSHESIQNTYMCTVCKKRFTRNDSLLKHERMHLPNRPFVCKCGKGFITKHHLVSHRTVHSKIKQFECVVCSKGFKFKVSLKKHVCQMPTE